MNINGTENNDTLNGTTENDYIFAYGGNDTINAEIGDDYINTGAGDDTVNAGDGVDYILGLEGNDTINGEGGNDRIFGDADNDVLYGGAGNDTLNGGTGNDALNGGFGSDQYIVDSAGDAVIESFIVDEIDQVIAYVNGYTLPTNVEDLTLASGTTGGVFSGTGNNLGNTILGNESNNYLYGLDGNDSIDGGAGNDLLTGDLGRDTLVAGTGNDQLYARAGSDTLTVGAGQDTIFLENPLDGIDTITDFVVADDVFYVEQTKFAGGLPIGTLSASRFRIGSSAQDSDDRFIYNRSTGALYFDKDGLGGATQIQLAKLSTGLAMTNQDFYIGLIA